MITGATQSLPRRIYEPYDEGMSLPAKLAQAGVRYCISDGGGDAYNARNLPYEAAMAAAFGLPHDEALKAVTLYPAQIFGVGDKIGSLEIGKIADVVVGDRRPVAPVPRPRARAFGRPATTPARSGPGASRGCGPERDRAAVR